MGRVDSKTEKEGFLHVREQRGGQHDRFNLFQVQKQPMLLLPITNAVVGRIHDHVRYVCRMWEPLEILNIHSFTNKMSSILCSWIVL